MRLGHCERVFYSLGDIFTQYTVCIMLFALLKQVELWIKIWSAAIG
jgi:hypothetical protein